METLQILFFAGLAVFLGWRLYLVLGRPTGRSPEEHAREQAQAERAAPPSERPLPREEADPTLAYSEPVRRGLFAIADADPRFDPDQFAEGAEAAYRMIVTAYAEGDRETLEPLLAPRVFERYAAAIEARESRGETQKTEVERIAKSEIHDAVLDGDTARVKVRFETELATETRDSDGERIAGDLSRLTHVNEIWSFERDVRSDDPNWKLAAVKPADASNG